MYTKLTFPSLLLLLVLILMIASQSRAQESNGSRTNLPGFWVETMTHYNTVGTGYGIKASMDFNRHQFHLRGIRANSRDYDQQTWEIGILYGRCAQINSWLISGATGVAAIGGYRYSDLWGQNGPEEMDTMIGFPMEGQIYWSPVSFAGVGLYAFVNVNTAQPIGGMGLSLKVGNLRSSR